MSLTGMLLVTKGRHNRVAREERGHKVTGKETDLGRRAVSGAVYVHEAAHPLNLRVVSGLVRIGAGLAITGNRAVNDPRIDPGHLRVVQAQSLHRPGSQVFQQDIGSTGQVQKHIAALGFFQVQSDAFDTP